MGLTSSMVLPSLHTLCNGQLKNLKNNIDCLSLDNVTVGFQKHPSCMDAQLIVVPSGTKPDSFIAINRIPVVGTPALIAFPYDSKVGKLTTGSRCACFAHLFDDTICQTELEEEPPIYRGLGGDVSDACTKKKMVKTIVRDDGSVTLEVGMNEVDGVDDALLKITKAIQQLTIQYTENPALEAALNALRFDEQEENNELDQFLKTVVECKRANLDLLIGIPNHETDGSTFTFVFEDIKQEQDKTLNVPCLSLIHEDDYQLKLQDDKPVVDNTNPYNGPLQQVRESYWVAYIKKETDTEPYNQIEISNPNGGFEYYPAWRQFYDETWNNVNTQKVPTKISDSVDNTVLFTRNEYFFMPYELEYRNSKSVQPGNVSLPTDHRSSGSGFSPSIFPPADTNKVEELKTDVLSKIAGWSCSQIAGFQYDDQVCVGNIVWMRTGDTKVATITLKVEKNYKYATKCIEGKIYKYPKGYDSLEKAKGVRTRLDNSAAALAKTTEEGGTQASNDALVLGKREREQGTSGV